MLIIPPPHTDRRKDVALTVEEKDIIAAQLNSKPDATVAQVFYEHGGCQEAVASLSSYYRIGRSMLCPTRAVVINKPPQAKKPTTVAPTLKATKPYETLVWDITYLPLIQRGQSLALHMVLDLYSRSVLDWVFSGTTSDRCAEEMFDRDIADSYNQGYAIKTVHSDNGRTMKSNRLKKLFATHEITMGFSRPHVSDDNPHMESSFSTLQVQEFSTKSVLEGLVAVS